MVRPPSLRYGFNLAYQNAKYKHAARFLHCVQIYKLFRFILVDKIICARYVEVVRVAAGALRNNLIFMRCMNMDQKEIAMNGAGVAELDVAAV